jgi:nucleolar complex protein 3
VDNLPSIGSHDEDEASWSSNVDEESSSSSESSEADSVSSSDNAPDMPDDLDSDTEMLYEAVPRKRRLSWDRNQDSGIPRLPIKLPDGRVQKVDIDIPRALTQVESDISEEDEASGSKERMGSKIVEDISTGARFGRPAVIDVIGKSSRKARIQESKEEIASICQATIAEPENSVSTSKHISLLPWLHE